MAKATPRIRPSPTSPNYSLTPKTTEQVDDDRRWLRQTERDLASRGSAGQAIVAAALAMKEALTARGRLALYVDCLRAAVIDAKTGVAAQDKLDHEKAYRLCLAAQARGERLSYDAGLAMAKAAR